MALADAVKNPTEDELALMLTSEKDPVTAFIDSIGNAEVREHARRTIEMRKAFVTYANAVLNPVDVETAVCDAMWLRENAEKVAYRWAALVRAAKAWAALIEKPTYVKIDGPV